MTDFEAWKLRQRMLATALRMGFAELSEDLAQESFVLYLQKKNKPTVMNHIVIDAARILLGDSRLKNRLKMVSLDRIQQSHSKLKRQIF